MELLDILRFDSPFMTALIMFGVWSWRFPAASRTHLWVTQVPLVAAVTAFISLSTWLTGDSFRLWQMAEGMLTLTFTAGVPIVLAGIGESAVLNRQGGHVIRVLFWLMAAIASFFSFATALVVHGHFTGDWI